METAATLRHLARYPVKSMRGETLSQSTLTLQGLPEDRRYAFVQTASRSSFPWLTAREYANLLLYETSTENAGAPEAAVTVTVPDGNRWPVQSAELLQELESRSGRKLFLLRDARGCYDAAQISLLGSRTAALIAAESGTPEDFWRFRPNLLVDLEEPFAERAWVGKIVRVGPTARIAITETDFRCVMINFDPATGKPSPSVLKCVVQRHQQNAGVYGSVITPGEVRPGDRVTVEN